MKWNCFQELLCDQNSKNQPTFNKKQLENLQEQANGKYTAPGA